MGFLWLDSRPGAHEFVAVCAAHTRSTRYQAIPLYLSAILDKEL